MRKTRWLLGTALLMLCITAHAQTEVSPQLLRNNDVLRMVEDKIQPEIIISKILTSPCNFDVFPPDLRDLRRRGVPEKVLMVMKVVPNGPPGLADVDSKPAPPVPRVQIPAGTLIELETSTATSSSPRL